MEFEGTITRVAPQTKPSGEETGWFEIVFGPDAPIPKAATNYRERAAIAAQIRDSGERWKLDIFEQPGKPNPRGGVYPPNYYFNGGTRIETNGSSATFDAPALDAPAPSPANQTRGEDPERSWRICLQTGGKLAVATMPLMPVDQRSFDVQKQIATAWATFFYFTPPPASGVREFAGGSGSYDSAATGERYESAPDDDIPW
jgi:hypothetical protein